MGNSSTKYAPQELLNYATDDGVSPPLLTVGQRYWDGSTWQKVTANGGGTQYADGDARGTATGTLAMVDDGANIQSLKGDSSGNASIIGTKFNNGNTDDGKNVGVLPAQVGASAPTLNDGRQASLRVTTSGDTAVTLDGEAVVLGAGTAEIGNVKNSGTFPVQATSGATRTYKTYSGTFTADTDVIAAVTSKKIKVFAYSIIVTDNTADTVIFKSNGTAGTELWRVYLRGPDANTGFGANLSVAPGLDGAHLFETAAGEKLTADVSSGATIHLSLSYWDNDAS